MKHIVVVGAGFGGCAAVLELCRSLSGNKVKITVINPEPYHTFHANLYEIATAPEDFSNTQELAKTCAIPLAQIFSPDRVEIVIGYVRQVDDAQKRVELTDGTIIAYDYIICAFGSKPCFFDIPGAERYALPLRTVVDALRIRNQIEFMVQSHRTDIKKQYVRLIIVGGGIAGAEFAAEAKNFLDILAWKNGYPRHKIEIVLIEAKNDLASGLNERVGQKILYRLMRLGVTIKLNTKVVTIDDHAIVLETGERLNYDCLVWTGGIQAANNACGSNFPRDPGHRVEVDAFLQMPGTHDAFMIGDSACVHDADGRPVPSTASQAGAQGRYVGRLIAAIIRGRALKSFEPKQWGFAIPLGGKWAIVTRGDMVISGPLGYLFREYAILRYFISILGLIKGIKLFFTSGKIHSRND